MDHVFLLQHSYEYEGVEETKIIGIYRTEAEAREVIEHYRKLEGFKRYPDDFCLDKYPLGKNMWPSGFCNPSEEEETSSELPQKQPIGECYVCSQGWAVIMREISTGTHFVYCNECETEWNDPVDFNKRHNEKRFVYGNAYEPDDEELAAIGWERYVDRKLKLRLSETRRS